MVLACVIMLARVMVLAHVIVLACVMVLVHVIVLAHVMPYLHGSHGLSAKDEVKRPEGPLAKRNRGPEGP